MQLLIIWLELEIVCNFVILLLLLVTHYFELNFFDSVKFFFKNLTFITSLTIWCDVCLHLNHVLRANNYIYTKLDLVIIILNLLQYDDTELHNTFAYFIITRTVNKMTALLESNVKNALLEFYYFKNEKIIEYLQHFFIFKGTNRTSLLIARAGH